MPSEEQLAEVAARMGQHADDGAPLPDDPTPNDPPADDPPADDPPSDPPQESEAEQKARADGWVPEDEWTGDPDKWVGAERFNERGEFIDRIKSQSKELKDLRAALGDLKDMTQRQADLLRERHSAEIQNQRRQAIEVGDVDAVERLDKMERDFNSKLESKTQAPQADPEIEGWVQKNPWFDQKRPEFDPAAAQVAVAKFGQFQASGAPIGEALEKTDEYMRRRYPDLYGIDPGQQHMQRRSSHVETPTPRTSASRKRERAYADLPEEAKQVANRMVRAGAYESRDAYAKDYFDSFGDQK